MKLKKLELSGFKSFKNKTIITFDKGLTALVGPNGCGKSNIVDAILWVTGEQSSKTLRSYSMEDVIFNGSSDSRKASMAEVSITLENDGASFPSKYSSFSEITLTRKIYRSGESEYLINNNFCRLKDIREVFMDSGVRTYAIIEQGEINRVIMSTPKDRRYIIEEAAGISKYKFRKSESAKKLKDAQENLDRLNDILGDLEERLKALEKQALDAKKYNELKDKQTKLAIESSVLRYKDVDFQIEELTASWKSISEEIEQLTALSLEKELYLQDLVAKKGTFLSEIKELSMSMGEKKAEYQSLKSKKELLDREIDSLKTAISKTKTRLDELSLLLSDTDKKILELNRQKEEINNSLSSLDTEVSNPDLTELYAEKEGLETEIKKKEDELVELQTYIARLQSNIDNHNARIDSNNLRLERARSEKTRISQDLNNLEESFNVLNDSVLGFKSKKDELELKVKNLSSKIDEKNKVLAGYSKQLESLSIEISQKKAELHFLESASFDSGLSTDLVSLADAIVTDYVSVPEEYKEVVKTYIAKWSKVLIVNENTKLREFLNIAKTENTVFGVLNTEYVKTSRITHGDYIFGANASKLTHIMDLLSYDKSNKHIVSAIFNNVFIVEDWETALEIVKSAKSNDYVLLSKTGEVIYPDGVVFTGASSTTKFYINRTKRIETIKSTIASIKATMNELEGKKAKELEELERLNNEFENLRVALNGLLIEFATGTSSLESLNARINDLKTRISELDFDIEQVNYENASLIEDRDGFAFKLTENNKQVEVLSSDIQELNSRLAELSKALEEANTRNLEYTSKKILFEERLQTVQSEIDRLTNLKDNSQKEFINLGSELGVNEERLSKIELEYQELIKDLAKWADTDFGEQSLKELEKNIQSLELSELEISKELNELKESLSNKKLELNNVSNNLEQLRQEEENIAVLLWEKYETRIDTVLELNINKSLETINKELNRVTKRLKNFGAVNLLAIEEYQELLERYEFLKAQTDDIIKSRDNLKRIVKKMDLTSKERFKEAFDSINKNFRAFFPVLFNGGEAELVLTDPDDLLNTGFDIVAKLPGKAKQSLSLFSGGEKALTAISLILAVFATRPAPFCVLDEVDAPLDDANIVRFNEAISAMSDNSQFIVVTHSKTTMSYMDRIYGVTMQNKGISKVFNINMEDIKQRYMERKTLS